MNSKYRIRYSEEQKQEIIRLKSTGLSNEKIAIATGVGIGSVAKIAKVAFPFVPKENPGYEKICNICDKIFYDVDKRHKSCSLECRNEYLSMIKIKYTEEQIQNVIKLKKQGLTNNEITNRSHVKLSKVKEIVRNIK